MLPPPGTTGDSETAALPKTSLFNGELFSLSVLGAGGGQREAEGEGPSLPKSPLRPPSSVEGPSLPELSHFSAHRSIFCSRAGCPVPRLLTTNRTSERARWFPLTFQPASVAPTGTIWRLFCFAVTAGTSRGCPWGCLQGSLASPLWPRAHPLLLPGSWQEAARAPAWVPSCRLTARSDGEGRSTSVSTRCPCPLGPPPSQAGASSSHQSLEIELESSLREVS